ncbi:glycosyltransferase family 1 protein [Erwinia psidii]|uniref:glycosyltransferase n=1 Tax=Erwinia psidii TaxID=69224 RepID=UPI00226B4BB7|nr:glycosyltransferase [Erwinia psidii]MCX8956307.1 glycosyltransferase family 1 protein [Erwinia psidii]MCX8959933.1 glycosyltransferase family 1 protein [Erwinia psidii]
MPDKLCTNTTEETIASASDPFVDKLHQLRPDIPASDIKNMILNREKYYAKNIDVAESGMCAVTHFFDYGLKEGRGFSVPELRHKKTYPDNPYSTTMIHSGFPKTSGTNLYRGTFPYENKKNVIFNHIDRTLKETIVNIFSSGAIILIRPNYDPVTIYIMMLCNRLGVKVTLDIDDLMLPEYVSFQGAVRSRDFDELDLKKILDRDSSLLLLADKILCSTPELVEIYSKSHRNVSLLRNKLPVRFSAKYQNKNTDNTAPLRLLYLSGTKTHVMDFSVISGVLMNLAQSRRNNIEITFLGTIGNYARAFKAVGATVNESGVVGFEKMLEIISRHDVVLVPLEETVFNNSKSNIKFIEAAAAHVPVIASPVREFSQYIVHGVNGWLCRTADEWHDLISELIDNRHLLAEAGKQAFLTFRAELSYE